MRTHSKAAAAGGLSCARPQGLLHVDARGHQRRHNRKEQHRERGDRNRAEEHRSCDANLIEPWCAGRCERHEATDCRRREHGAQDPAGGGKDGTLGEELRNESRASGTECGPHSELAHAPESAYEEQICHVDARDQKKECRGGREGYDGGSDVADHIIGERVCDADHAPPRTDAPLELEEMRQLVARRCSTASSAVRPRRNRHRRSVASRVAEDRDASRTLDIVLVS